jgi:hypothetical protein
MKLSDFVRLDLKTISPYFGKKKTIVYLIVACIIIFFLEFTLNTHIPFFTLSLFGMAMVMVDIFPFLLEERNELNTFYVTQNIPRETVVNGRYLYALTLNSISVAAACVIDIVVLIARGNFSEILSELTNSAAILLLMQIYISFCYPLNFKLGYAKSKAFTSIVPLIMLGAPLLFIAFLSINGLITFTNGIRFGTVLILIGTTLMITSISIEISKKFYAKREF